MTAAHPPPFITGTAGKGRHRASNENPPPDILAIPGRIDLNLPKPENPLNPMAVNRLEPKEQVKESACVAGYTYRYYDPVTGRWPSRDPMELNWKTKEYNEYAFVRNNSTSWIDVLGLAISIPFGGGDIGDANSTTTIPSIEPPTSPEIIVEPDTPTERTATARYVCRKRVGADGTSQEGAGYGDRCCLDAHCTYDCTEVFETDEDELGVPIIFEFKICGEDKNRVGGIGDTNHLSAFCPDVIELSMTTYKNGTFSTGDIPPNSPPTSLQPTGSLP
jgi:RHS repeat-associated protein